MRMLYEGKTDVWFTDEILNSDLKVCSQLGFATGVTSYIYSIHALHPYKQLDVLENVPDYGGFRRIV